MQRRGSKDIYSASDLVNFAACTHLTHLDLVNLTTPLVASADTDEMKLIQGKGFEHEARYLRSLQDAQTVTDLSKAGGSDEAAFAATTAALRRGDAVVFQATLQGEPWVGHADFLIRVDEPSLLGEFSYEVVDTKLARSSRGKFLVQLLLYSEMLGNVQGRIPKRMHIVLGDGRQQTFAVDDYLRYYRRLKQRFLEFVVREGGASYPEKSERCGMCRWRELCADVWERDDHLNRVSGVTRLQIHRLNDVGITTMKALSTVDDVPEATRIQVDTLKRLSQQARLQIQSAATGQPIVELLPLESGAGFARLPPPAAGDLYFDMEGDPLEEGGLEYLFGLYHFTANGPVFKAFWAHSRQEERAAFEAFMDFVTAHLKTHSDAHIYHYAPYERTALQRLMSLHGTREDEVDNLLRAGKLVDLYGVVRGAIRVGEPSYSIKKLERFYGGGRDSEVKTAGASIVYYENWKTTREQHLLDAIEAYNLEDVRSTHALREWLIRLRPADATWLVPGSMSGGLKPVKPKSEKAEEAAAELERYRQQLVEELPEERHLWTDEHRIQELLFHLLSFHRRCEKPVWWSLFDHQLASEEELIEDIDYLGGLKQSREREAAGDGYYRYWYQYPDQETKLRTGSHATVTELLKEVDDLVVDAEAREVSFVFAGDDPLPTSQLSLGPGLPIPTAVIRKAVMRFVDEYLAGGTKYAAGLAFLRREAPRVLGVAPGTPLISEAEALLDGCVRVASGLQGSTLFVQGPPGAGKTFTASHVIVQLLKAGKKVGVSSNSHKAINNLLYAVEKVAVEVGLAFKGAKKSSGPDSELNGNFIEDVGNSQSLIKRLKEFDLVAGTAWLFSAAKLDQTLDYLFVDEAGQVSLANLVAISTTATNVVLLGDQMQLGQPIQGVHPSESGLSTLDYLLEGRATISADRGVFLRDSWRMHPDVCAFISAAVYEGKLKAEAANSHQRLVLALGAHSLLRPTGIAFARVEHEGCSQQSIEEAQLVAELVRNLLEQRYLSRDEVERSMELNNILVVAPYNLQVNLLKRCLPAWARVGTVDKFQGQEAEVVIVSMTTSSGEYLPRNIEFLYNKNRLNVAVSRARCLAIVIANPALLDVECKTPEQMALVNTLSWAREYACQ